MSASRSIASHYTSGRLLERVQAALRDDGFDLDRIAPDDLFPYDQFHGRGLEATEEIFALARFSAADHILDVGCGIGGPARLAAERFGSQVTGIDLTGEFCQVARYLNRQVGLDAKVEIVQGDAAALPFKGDHFGGAYSINVVMNIADKTAFYDGIHRVLKPGAQLLLCEVAQGSGGEVDYPTPWAQTARSSFLATPEETATMLEASGFTDIKLRDTTKQSVAYGAAMRARKHGGAKPTNRAAELIHGELASVALRNSSRAVKLGQTIPIEVSCFKPSSP